MEAEQLGYDSKEPSTHHDSPSRWNSTHQMCSGTLQKGEALDLTMMTLVGAVFKVVEDWSQYEFPLCPMASHCITGCQQKVKHGLGSALNFTCHLIKQIEAN